MLGFERDLRESQWRVERNECPQLVRRGSVSTGGFDNCIYWVEGREFPRLVKVCRPPP
jgi:hypothetical protein